MADTSSWPHAATMFLLDQIADPENKEWIVNKGRESRIVELWNHAWARVMTIYHAAGHAEKTEDQIKKKWDNLITKAKREEKGVRKYRNGTGGGPAKPLSLTTYSEKTMAILGNHVRPLANNNNSDKDHLLPNEVVDD